MAENRNGLRALVNNPRVYELIQNLMGAKRNSKRFADNFIKAKPGDRLLDIGCGPGSLVQFLPDVEYVGYDPNPSYIAAAHATYGGKATFRLGIFDDQSVDDHAPFDIAVVSAVLHHLDDEQARDLFRLLRRALQSTGRVITLDNVYVDRQNPLARFIISQDVGQNVRTADGYAALAKDYFRFVKGTIIHQSFIPYTYWIMECHND
ncbi:class I SAM-dependent methyltransferase [Microvirga sp. M2]|uniref:class I SAM-dependent methyltransferase n=1 Tax=Microvirga sp. M2 TaxID=3073270 RepID=UPI0039C1B8E4